MTSKDYASIVDKSVRTVKDFPKEGINFRDISTMLADPQAFKDCMEGIYHALEDVEYDVIAGVETRGFIFGSPLAIEKSKKFVMIRKPNKLPGEKISYTYKKEYGEDTLQVAANIIGENEKVIVIDDLLATGGSALAACNLIRACKANPVAVVCPIELGGLPGRELLEKEGIKVISLLITDDK